MYFTSLLTLGTLFATTCTAAPMPTELHDLSKRIELYCGNGNNARISGGDSQSVKCGRAVMVLMEKRHELYHGKKNKAGIADEPIAGPTLDKRIELYCGNGNSARLSGTDGEAVKCGRAVIEARKELYSGNGNSAHVEDTQTADAPVQKRKELYSGNGNKAQIEEEQTDQ